MKKKILLTAFIIVGLATIGGAATALLVTDTEFATRLLTASGMLVAGSIGMFFIGAVVPKD